MTMSEDETAAETLIRMNEQWGPEGYAITYSPGQPMQWHAKYEQDGSQWHAPTSQRLHMALFEHWASALEDLSLDDLYPSSDN